MLSLRLDFSKPAMDAWCLELSGRSTCETRNQKPQISQLILGHRKTGNVSKHEDVTSEVDDSIFVNMIIVITMLDQKDN